MKTKHFQLKAVVVILLLSAMFSLANAAHVESIQVDALSTSMLTVNLKSGQKFSGSLSISGGGGNDIDFWVTDPVGATIVNLGRVSQGSSFEFTANKDGAYTLHFGNTFSWFSSKTVYLTYDVGAPPILGLDPFILIAIVAVVLILVAAIVAIGYSRRKAQKTIQPPPPPKAETKTEALNFLCAG